MPILPGWRLVNTSACQARYAKIEIIEHSVGVSFTHAITTRATDACLKITALSQI